MAAPPPPPQVQLHPVAQRNHNQPQSGSSSPFATPFFPKLDTLLNPPPRPLRRPTLSPTQSALASPPSPLPASHGLQLDPTAFPLFSTAPDAHPIRVISANHYAQLHDAHTKEKLPEHVLFPWLHGGADVPYSPASQYFGFVKGTAARAPSYRGLTTVHAPPPPSPAPSHSRQQRNRGLTSSFASWSTSSSSSSSSSSPISSPSPSPPPSSIPTARLVSSFPASTILSDTNDFAVPAPNSFHTVNLRHFALQGPKYASVSDIVVYGEYGIDESVVDTAMRIVEAQEKERHKRGSRAVQYNVYIVSDPFTTFERDHPTLVGIDSHGFSKNKLNFFEREREEMRVLTQASEIAENVWLGNSQDVPVAPYHHHLTSDSTSSLLDDGNPLSFAICLEAHDQATLLSPSVLTSSDQILSVYEEEGQAFEDVRQLVEEPSEAGNVSEERVKILRPHVQEVVHLECLSTSSNIGPSTRTQTNFVNGLVDLALWIRNQACPTNGRLPRRVLLHCADGYTETSLLGLTYIMLTRRCTAPDAYLYLQNDALRSFFVYPVDSKMLLKVEQRVSDILLREDEEALAAHQGRWDLGDVEDDTTIALSDTVGSSGMERSDSGYVSNCSSMGSPSKVESLFSRVGNGIKRSSPPPSEADTSAGSSSTSSSPSSKAARLDAPLPSLPKLETSSIESHPWFFGETFEGHFPSRILPFLYLGNLNHASNALMLKSLGITHVVSMGESAMAPPRPPPFSLAKAFGSPTPEPPTNSLWLEEQLGNISVLDMKNVADDGIDSIRPYIDQALAFIDEARWNGGKVLVHCRVGVSRSASIVIAYLMKHVELDLASAYLLTRSRRLNILIQPNLPFMATLHAFEADLLEEKDHRIAAGNQEPDDDSEPYLGRAGLKRSNRLAFNFISNEIATLNERFLC